MNTLFALRMLTDFCYYCFAMASLGTLARHSGMLITSPLIIAVAAWFVPAVIKKWPANSRLHYLPLAICALTFIFTRTIADVVITIPMIGYLFFIIYKRMVYVDYDGSYSRFFLCLKLIPVPAFLTLISANKDGFMEVMLPYFFFFLILSFMMLRMLRHSEKVLFDRRFRFMNVAEIGLLCGVGYLMSSGLMISLIKFIGTLIMKYILDPIFTGLSYVLGGVVWVLDKLFGWIDLFPEGVDVSELETGTGMTEGEAAIWEYYEEAAETSTTPQILTYVAIGVGVVLLVVILVLLFRALARMGRKNNDNQFADVRESVTEKGEGRKDRLGLSYRDRVRQVYRKFLRLCYKMGVDPEENLNSRDINDQVSHRLNRPALKGLRGVYLRARYSSGDITKDDLKAAKEAFDNLNKSE